MTFESEIAAELAKRLLDGRADADFYYGLPEDQFTVWSERHGRPLLDVFNVVARWIATEFHARRLSFEEGDAWMNDLQPSALHLLLPNGGAVDQTELWWRVYEAFDLGEYARVAGQDPVETDTRPLIDQILRTTPAASAATCAGDA